MSDDTPDRDDTREREAEKREAQEQDTEGTGGERERNGDVAEEGVLGGTPGHIPARSD